MFHVSASRDLRWIAQRTGGSYSREARAIEARDERTGRTVAMVAYDGFTQNGVQMSIALDVPMAFRRLARPMFAYPFEELEKGVAFCFVSSANTRSLQLTAHVGFRCRHKIKDAILPGVDLVLFEMRPNECRWLEGH